MTKYVGIDSLNTRYANDSEDAVVKITGLILNDGTIIDLKEKEPQIDLNGKPNAVYYDISDSQRASISLVNISLFRIEIVKARSLGPTVVILSFVWVGIIAGLISLQHFH
jgi:hypothetical protein